MAVAMNRPLVGPRVQPRPVAPAFAQKSAASKVALGWKETVKDLPSEAVDKLKRTAHAIANPIDTAKDKWAEIKANPKKALVPLAMMAGGAALSAVSPGLMRYVGLAMTGSMFVLPTIKFARSESEQELMAVADGTSKQMVNYAASYATSWAAGKVIRYSLQKIQERRAGVGTSSIQGKGDVAAKTADKTPDIQAKGDTPDQLMKVSKDGQLNPDEINFDYVRNNKEAGHQFVTDVRSKVKSFYVEQLTKQNPGASKADIEAFIASADGRSLRLQMVQDVRGIVHANYLGYHGVQVPEGMAISDMVGTRKYLQDIHNTYDIADAVKGINAGLAKGVTTAAPLAVEAERFLYNERGVTQPFFSKFEKVDMTGQDLKKVRTYADHFATGQSGKYLKVAAMNATAADVGMLRGVMTRQMLTDIGFIVPKDVDNRTMASIVRDLASEDPKNVKAITQAVNEAFRQGKTNYYEINEFANRKLLKGLGVGEDALKALEVSDEALKAAHPRYPVELARAEQIRLLRDRLRTLPEAHRADALKALVSGKADLLSFDQVLTPHLETKIGAITGSDAKLVATMTQDMTAQQKANFLTDLARLPEDVRAEAFKGLAGTPEQMNKTVVDRLSTMIEQKFEVKVHREAGRYPRPQEWARKDDPFVHDWSVQGSAQLFNGLERMGPNGQVPADLKGTLYVNMDQNKVAAAGSEGFVLGRPKSEPLVYYRPGSAAYQGGTMGYRTQLEGGQDMIVMFEASRRMPNADETPGVTLAEGTVIHESGHAVQMGGKPGTSSAAAQAQEQKLVREWSALSEWRERDGSLADGYYRIGGDDRRYYKDPAVQVGKRELVVTDYGATDTVEDFAEFTRVFYNDPGLAMEISPEKFLYMNQMYGNRYSAQETLALANGLGLGAQGIEKALASLRATIKGVPGNSAAQPGLVQRLAKAVLGKAA